MSSVSCSHGRAPITFSLPLMRVNCATLSFAMAYQVHVLTTQFVELTAKA